MSLIDRRSQFENLPMIAINYYVLITPPLFHSPDIGKRPIPLAHEENINKIAIQDKSQHFQKQFISIH